MAYVHVIPCPNCGAKNRAPQERIDAGDGPVCGRCKTPLRLAPMEVTDATFAEEVERSPLPVLVDLWAPWCGPCRMIAPVIEELVGEMKGRVRIAKLNTDQNPQTMARFRVDGIPTLLLFNGGELVDRIVGLQPKSILEQRLERLAAGRQ
jgi:thioredoxin 2